MGYLEEVQEKKLRRYLRVSRADDGDVYTIPVKTRVTVRLPRRTPPYWWRLLEKDRLCGHWGVDRQFSIMVHGFEDGGEYLEWTVHEPGHYPLIIAQARQDRQRFGIRDYFRINLIVEAEDQR